MKLLLSLAALALFVAVTLNVRAQEAEGAAQAPVSPVVTLAPTAHPALPDRTSDFWFVPETFQSPADGRTESVAQKFAHGARLIEEQHEETEWLARR